MFRIALLLVCLACEGHGHISGTGRLEAQSSSHREDRSPRSDVNAVGPHSRCSSLRTLATLFLALNQRVGWQTIGTGNSHSSRIQRVIASGARSRAMALMSDDNGVGRVEETGSLEVSSPVLKSLDRRTLLASSAALGSLFLPKVAVPPALAADEDVDIEYTVSQATLLASVATAPTRDIVITGCNSGVGLAGAKTLAAAGHRVVCACRTQAKADAAVKEVMAYVATNSARAGGSAVAAVCDLSSLSSVRAFAKSIEGSKIDTLVLNAGVALGTDLKEPTRTADGFEEMVGVNHLGHFLLANLLIPTLAASQKPRLVITASPVHDPTSGGGKVGSTATLGDLTGLASGAKFDMVDGGKYDPDKAYKDSKLCNLMFLAEASRRLAPKGITVNAFSPGLIADPKGFFRYQNKVFAPIFYGITQAVGVGETNEFGGSGLSYLAVDPAADGVTGKWFDSFPPGKHQLAVHAPSEEARRIESQKKLWELSSDLVGLKA